MDGGQPIDLYDFVTPTTTYRVTSYHRDVAFGGNTYAAITIARADLAVVGAPAERQPLTVDLPVAHPICQRYLASGIPPKNLKITVRRLQKTSGAAMGQWSGYANAVSVAGRTASFQVVDPLAESGIVNLPTIGASNTCQAVLYDSICQVAKAPLKVTTTIASIDLVTDPTGRTVVLADAGSIVSGHGNGYFDHGFFDLGGSNDNPNLTIASQVGATVVLRVPPVGSVIGASVDVFPGCDKQIATCFSKFGNVINFVGFPYLDGTINPWAPRGTGVLIQS